MKGSRIKKNGQSMMRDGVLRSLSAALMKQLMTNLDAMAGKPLQ